MSSSAAGKKAVFLEQSVFVPNRHVLAELSERESQRELTAERVAIRPDMTEHGEALMCAKGGGDFREGGVAHALVGLGVVRPFVSRRWSEFDFLQDLEDARAALDRIIEMKNEMRRVFQNDVFGELGLEDRRDSLPVSR